MSRLSEQEAELSALWRGLQNEWADVRDQWQDRVAENFEREWWSELEQEIPSLIESVARLDEVFGQARSFISQT